ncbi:MAG: hypothetical protein QN163_10790, partial [Armatimonadota bacterium]|nr:hypothetical protein [Armatimonadota bacterium]
QVTYDRNVAFVQPFLAVVLAGGIVYLRDVGVRWPASASASAALGVVLAFALPAHENLQANLAYQFYRYDQAARRISRQYRPDDLVIYFPASIDVVFDRYFRPPGRACGSRPTSGVGAEKTTCR